MIIRSFQPTSVRALFYHPEVAGRQPEMVEYVPHLGESRQYWRDIILGVNDGLVSTFLLVVGVVGGGLNNDQVLLTGVAGAIAGAVSMAAGEYLATKSQDEILAAELELERTHIEHFREGEIAQLRGFFEDMGVEEEHLDPVVAAFEHNDEALLNAMAALEFSVVESERRSPFKAMMASGLLFLAGALPSVIPFALTDDTTTALIWATILALTGLVLVGVVKARKADSGHIRSGLENLLIAGVGGVIAYFIGDLVGTSLG